MGIADTVEELVTLGVDVKEIVGFLDGYITAEQRIIDHLNEQIAVAREIRSNLLAIPD